MIRRSYFKPDLGRTASEQLVDDHAGRLLGRIERGIEIDGLAIDRRPFVSRRLGHPGQSAGGRVEPAAQDRSNPKAPVQPRYGQQGRTSLRARVAERASRGTDQSEKQGRRMQSSPGRSGAKTIRPLGGSCLSTPVASASSARSLGDGSLFWPARPASPRSRASRLLRSRRSRPRVEQRAPTIRAPSSARAHGCKRRRVVDRAWATPLE